MSGLVQGVTGSQPTSNVLSGLEGLLASGLTVAQLGPLISAFTLDQADITALSGVATPSYVAIPSTPGSKFVEIQTAGTLTAVPSTGVTLGQMGIRIDPTSVAGTELTVAIYSTTGTLQQGEASNSGVAGTTGLILTGQPSLVESQLEAVTLTLDPGTLGPLVIAAVDEAGQSVILTSDVIAQGADGTPSDIASQTDTETSSLLSDVTIGLSLPQNTDASQCAAAIQIGGGTATQSYVVALQSDVATFLLSNTRPADITEVGDGTSRIIVSGPLADLSSFLGNVTVTLDKPGALSGEVSATIWNTTGVESSTQTNISVAPALPVQQLQTPNQSWISNGAITLALRASTFADPQNEALTYTAMVSNGQALPNWLHFDTSTETFTGVAPPTTQNLSVTVTATDTSGLSATEAFAVSVVAPPAVTDQTWAGRWNAGSAISFTLPADTFTDPQGETLTYTAMLADGNPLPSWLTFNATTQTFSGTAPNTTQNLSVTVTATDTSGLSATEAFAVSVVAPPAVTDQTGAGRWNAGSAISFTLPVDTFTDPQGETLTYTAMLANGSPLPSWLTFNATTQTFSGTAPNTAQNLSIKVTATDSSGLSATEAFESGVIAAPILTDQTGAETWNAGSAISFTLPADTFTDPQGETLTYTAMLANGSPLPSWLTFNATTQTFSGTAPNTAQNLSIKVTATNSSGLSATEAFESGVIAAPILTDQTGAETWNAGSAISFTLPADTFTDPQGETLTYTAMLANGSPLPSWLTFNATTQTFSGTAPNTAQNLSIKVTATNLSGLSATEAFESGVIAAPILTDQTGAETWNAGSAISFTLPADTFTDPQGETLTYTAMLANGSPLPSWLTFNATTQTFSGTAPNTAQNLSIKVTATDSSGLSNTETFSISLSAAPAVGDGTSGSSPPGPTPSLAMFDTTTNQSVAATAQPYTGPVAGLQEQYLNISPDSLNISVSTPNWFVHSGSGNDAIAVNSGNNVLDGGTGSNFLVGGTGSDTFFVDDRGPTSDIWSTVAGFHAGDAATIWGVTQQDFNLAWVDGQGAAGFTGLTLHATASAKPTASLTLTGFSSADLSDGRLNVSFGTVGGSSYMDVLANR